MSVHEAHMISGAGVRGGNSANDPANMLKPALVKRKYKSCGIHNLGRV